MEEIYAGDDIWEQQNLIGDSETSGGRLRVDSPSRDWNGLCIVSMTT